MAWGGVGRSKPSPPTAPPPRLRGRAAAIRVGEDDGGRARIFFTEV